MLDTVKIVNSSKYIINGNVVRNKLRLTVCKHFLKLCLVSLASSRISQRTSKRTFSLIPHSSSASKSTYFLMSTIPFEMTLTIVSSEAFTNATDTPAFSISRAFCFVIFSSPESHYLACAWICNRLCKHLVLKTVSNTEFFIILISADS